MVSICNMSRYITIIVVENLTKTAILKAIQQHKFRFGETKEIFSDKGTNYTGAQRVLEEENEESLTQSVMKDVKKVRTNFLLLLYFSLISMHTCIVF